MSILKKKKQTNDVKTPDYNEDSHNVNNVRTSRREQNMSDLLERINNQDSIINEIRESLVSKEDIRRIISEELSKILNKGETDKQSLTIISDNNHVEVLDNEEKKNVYSRISFPERMLVADDELKRSYNEIKCLALAYGLKSRISNSGDTFRLHTKTYMKISIAGSSLKLHFALNPEDYMESSIPFSDASLKNMYKDIPLVFKVKSQLSLRRAKQLLADACKKNNLYPDNIIERDWVSPLRDYQPQIGLKNVIPTKF